MTTISHGVRADAARGLITGGADAGCPPADHDASCRRTVRRRNRLGAIALLVLLAAIAVAVLLHRPAPAARLTSVGFSVGAAGFLAFTAVAALQFRRYERRRAADRAELLRAVTEARTLSMVAARTDNLVIVTDHAGRIQWVNDAFTGRTGYSLDEVLGRKPGSFLQGPDTDPETVDEMRDRVRRGEAFSVEVLNYCQDGSPIWVDIDAHPVHDEYGAITHFIAVESDITERRRVEHALRSTKEAAEDVARAKSDFLASMSHEIRTPLNALLGLTELLLTTELDDQQYEFASTANTSGQLLLEILNNVLDFSALESGRVELDAVPVDVRMLVDRVVATLGGDADRRMLSLSAVVDPGVPDVLVGDAARLQQILVNVVSNAVKFTEFGAVDLAVTWDGRELGVVVSDTGIGIPADRLDRLFEPFSQADGTISRRFGGTGLGLAISRHLSEMLGGTLTIDSIEHVGTTARITVPMSLGTRDQLPADVPALQPASRDAAPRILVAEDDAVNRRVAEHMLGRLGFRADFVHDGAAAVHACRTERYDLVLMDVQMPELDGVEATAEIRRRLPDGGQPTIVALTASALVGDRERFMEAGMDGYLAKPVQLRDLAEAIDQVCAVATSRATGGRQGRPAIEPAPINVDELRSRHGGGEGATTQGLVDVLVPVLLGQTNHAVSALRRAVDLRDAASAERLVADAQDSAASVSATGVVDALRLTAAAVRAHRWDDAMVGADDVMRELDRLRTWYVDRSVAAAVTA